MIIEILDFVGVGVEELVDLVEMVLRFVWYLLADLNVLAVFGGFVMKLVFKLLDVSLDVLWCFSYGNHFSEGELGRTVLDENLVVGLVRLGNCNGWE